MRIQSCFHTAILFIASLSSFCSGSLIFNSVSRDSLYVGDRIRFDAILLVPRVSQVVPPPTENGFGKLSVKEWTSDKAEKKNADSLTFHYTLTTYSTENCTIPSLDFLVAKGQAVDTLRTRPIPLRVLLVTSPDTAAIKDLKAQQDAGTPSLIWLWLLCAAIVTAAAVFLFRRFLLKRRRPQAVVPPKPPYDEAMEALDRLEVKQYIAKGMIREYAFELSEIVKRYIERRFEVNAAEFTTEEMLDWIKLSPLAPDDRKSIEWFFSTTDPVKFAKWLPDNDTVYRFGPGMRSFVEKTRPQAAQPGKKETNSPAAAPPPAGTDGRHAP